MSNGESLVYFMRKPDRVSERYLYQGHTQSTDYSNSFYFSFIVSDEAAQWIHDKNKTHYCYLKYEMLRQTLLDSGVPDDHFIDDNESTEVLNISDKELGLLISHVDCDTAKPIVNEDYDE